MWLQSNCWPIHDDDAMRYPSSSSLYPRSDTVVRCWCDGCVTISVSRRPCAVLSKSKSMRRKRKGKIIILLLLIFPLSMGRGRKPSQGLRPSTVVEADDEFLKINVCSAIRSICFAFDNTDLHVLAALIRIESSKKAEEMLKIAQH